MTCCLWKGHWAFICVSSPIRSNSRSRLEKTSNKAGSVVSSIYYPLRFLAPVSLSGKKILQNSCRQQLVWDDTVIVSAAQEWKVWLKELHQLGDFKVRRCLKPLDFGKISSAQLHHFADASVDGYGKFTYINYKLTVAVVMSRRDKLWRKKLKMTLLESIFWTDSTSILKYIGNRTAR